MTQSTAVEPARLGSSSAVLEAYAHSVMNTFGPPKRVFVRGEGCYSGTPTAGGTSICCPAWRSMPSVTPIPTVLSAITGQIATLGHVSNFFATPAQVALAARLSGMTGAEDARRFSSPTQARRQTRRHSRSPG